MHGDTDDTHTQRRIQGGVRESLPHESAGQHVRGAAWYTDDLPEPNGTLHAALGLSERAHAEIVSLDLNPVRHSDGVRCVLTAADIVGDNNCGPIVADDPIFAEGVVEHVGQSLFAVAADTVRAARQAVRRVEAIYRDRPAAITVNSALAAGQFLLPTEQMTRGDPDTAIGSACHQLDGEFVIGGQEQFYLEGQIALAIPLDDGGMHIYSSTQFPMEVQAAVARCLGRERMTDIVVECRRMGGAFGGKESQPALFACVAALLAEATGRPVKLRMDRDDDMRVTGKRHDFVARYQVGFDAAGTIEGYRVNLASRCGRSADLSGAINDRAMFHSDNAYFLPHVAITSERLKTHTVSNTAFRGFGGPQGMLVIEEVMDAIAQALGKDPLSVRRANLYGGAGRNVTPYGMTVEDNILPELLDELVATSDYHQRRQDIARFNAGSEVFKRGIALTPVKFGISFTATHLNQAGALVHLYHDGSVHLNHGGTEMGQGLFTKIAQIVAEELQIDVGCVRATATDTGKVPNASATAASSGTDLNGKAAQAAARTLRERLTDFAAEHYDVPREQIRFMPGEVQVGNRTVPFPDLIHEAYMNRVQLSATGFYKTPKIGYDRRTWSGRPFYYFAYGAAVSEVEIDTLTGEHLIRRVDILHDCGESLNEAIDRGQIEGGFLQGVGWLTCEELVYADSGELLTTAPSTYKIPACSDWPREWRVDLMQSTPNREDTVFRSKAVGEPPLMLANSVFLALKDAVASVAEHRVRPALNAPATPEAILLAVTDLRAQRTVDDS
ncbi:MAG: xanthine dehydrogenase molybdopterin binding subunit [Pseudomonadota bacterium]